MRFKLKKNMELPKLNQVRLLTGLKRITETWARLLDILWWKTKIPQIIHFNWRNHHEVIVWKDYSWDCLSFSYDFKYPLEFSHCDFTDSYIELAQLKNAKFINCTFRRTRFQWINIEDCEFIWCEFSETDFSNNTFCSFTKCKFNNCRFIDLGSIPDKFEECEIIGTTFNDENFVKINIWIDVNDEKTSSVYWCADIETQFLQATKILQLKWMTKTSQRAKPWKLIFGNTTIPVIFISAEDILKNKIWIIFFENYEIYWKHLHKDCIYIINWVQEYIRDKLISPAMIDPNCLQPTINCTWHIIPIKLVRPLKIIYKELYEEIKSWLEEEIRSWNQIIF